MSVYQSNVSKNKVELKQAQYKDIDKRYYDQLIQLKVEHFASFFNLLKLSIVWWTQKIFATDNWDGEQGPGQILQCPRQVSWPLIFFLYSPFVCFLMELILATLFELVSYCIALPFNPIVYLKLSQFVSLFRCHAL